VQLLSLSQYIERQLLIRQGRNHYTKKMTQWKNYHRLDSSNLLDTLQEEQERAPKASNLHSNYHNKLNSIFVITIPLPSAKLIAWRTGPVASDLTITILAGLALDVRCLLILLSTAHMNIDATI
jgi:hypothetical protein